MQPGRWWRYRTGSRPCRTRSPAGCQGRSPRWAPTGSASPTRARRRGGSSTSMRSRSPWPCCGNWPGPARWTPGSRLRPSSVTGSTSRLARRCRRQAMTEKRARAGGPRVNAETVRRIERATGTLGTAAIAAMDKRLPWFRSMSAENRSWLGLVAQAAIAAFLDWIRHPERDRPAVTQVFGTAPRELARAVSLQHAVEMMRVIIDAVEAQVDELAAPGNEAELREAVLTYAREIAFSAALVYARTAEARGAWDARLEALVVDSLVHGETDDSLRSWASALNWSSSPVTVVVGTIGDEDDEEHKGQAPAGVEPLIEDLRAQARRARLDLLAGVHGNRLILVVGGSDDPIAAAERFAGRFGPGPVIAGPLVRDLRTASVSARAALAALRAAPAWPDAPRPAGA